MIKIRGQERQLRKRPKRPMQSQVRKARLSDQERSAYAFVHWVNQTLDAEFKRLVERDG